MMSRITLQINVAIVKMLPILLLCAIHAWMPYTCSGENQGSSDHLNITSNINPTRACRPYIRCRETNSDSVSSIRYGESLVSEERRFKLGFLVRGGGTYLAIWYNGTDPEAVVWVANRDDPIPPQLKHNSSLVIGKDGKARLLDSSTNHTYWSTEQLQTQLPTEPTARILLKLTDNGNLVSMVDKGTRGNITLWQSFDHPTDTFLYGMPINAELTSWVSPENPARGSYRFKSVTNSSSTVAITKTKGFIPYWENSLSALPPNVSSFLDGSMAPDHAWSLRLVLNSDGSIRLWGLDKAGRNWSSIWLAPEDQCDLFETCGSFGVCDATNGFRCKCLPGFEPSDPDRWEARGFDGNQCSRTTTTETCGGHVFVRLPMVKVQPDPTSSSASSEAQCHGECLGDCGCSAYSYDPAQSNCQLWTHDLYNIQEEYNHPGARTLYVRVAASDIDFGKRACNICGTNVVPYPLSTGLSCGDPSYSSFQCNDSNGQLYFRPPNKSLYKVSHINQDRREFIVQLPEDGLTSDKCDGTNKVESSMFNLNESSSPFRVTNCSVVALILNTRVVEVAMSWTPPKPPACNTSADCIDWPHTGCYQDADKKMVCICAKGFRSETRFMNCTKVDHKGMLLRIKAAIACACGVVVLFCSMLCILIRLRKGRAARRRAGIAEMKKDNDIEDTEIPFVDYESILAATDNFSDENKLGVGGFGPVYKGKLADGNVVAVKRLSAASVQGIEEFRNEVILIAKLQHRNLVRVVAYCIKEEEKILVYEYMSNKSLDVFLFDQTISPSLDWIKRFDIILGIARGLVYLHQDSRLRIIHRDLKPSNILLDEELNPKISDFGLARIAAGNEMATTTARVIGTQGYMSPEYALEGHFSIKSDVYSFGIIVLEIVSGKRCTSLLPSGDSLTSLLGYAWSMWDKGSPLELVHKSVSSCDTSQVKRCINVGLLCVQEDPSDRPTMPTTLLMLGGDSTNLPYPKQPVFVVRRRPPSETSSSSMFEHSSNAELTTTLEPR